MLSAATLLFGQQDEPMKLISSLRSRIDGVTGHMVNYQPVYEHKGSSLRADSGYLYTDDLDREYFDAFGHVVITQPDGTIIYANKLNYAADPQLAILTGNVRMVDSESTLTTNYLTYNMRNSIGTYTGGGRIVNQADTITSKNAWYFNRTKDAYFRYDVIVRTPDVQIYTDTMRYNSDEKTTYFYGPTNLKGKDGENLYTEEGYYNTETELAEFFKNNLYTETTRFLRGDTLYYDGKQGIGRALRHVLFVDTADQFFAAGHKALYNKEEESILMTDLPLITMVMDEDDGENDEDENVDMDADPDPDLDAHPDELEPPLTPSRTSSKVDSVYLTADTLYSRMIMLRDYVPMDFQLDREGGPFDEDSSEFDDEMSSSDREANRLRDSIAQEQRAVDSLARDLLVNRAKTILEDLDQSPPGRDSLKLILSREESLEYRRPERVPVSMDSISLELDSVSIDSIPLELDSAILESKALELDSVPMDSIPLETIPLDSLQLETLRLDSLKKDSLRRDSLQREDLFRIYDFLKKDSVEDAFLLKIPGIVDSLATLDSTERNFLQRDLIRKIPLKLDSMTLDSLRQSLHRKDSVENPVPPPMEIPKPDESEATDSITMSMIERDLVADSVLRERAQMPTGLEADSLMSQAWLSAQKTAPRDSLMQDSLTRDALMRDSLHLDTAKTRIIKAYRNVRLFKSDLQAVADSAYYGYPDSMMRFFGAPMAWTQGSQMSGDSLYLQIKNEKMDNMLLLGNAFIVNTKDSIKFNQIKGRKVTGFFTKGDLERTFVDGNAESLAYMENKSKTGYTDMYHSRSSRIKLLFKDNDMTDFIPIRSTEGTIYPLRTLTQDQEILDGFIWKPGDRPTSKEDLLSRKRAAPEPLELEPPNPDVDAEPVEDPEPDQDANPVEDPETVEDPERKQEVEDPLGP